MNKVIFSNGNVQFIEANGHITNVSPSKVYTRINGDTISFVFIAFAESSGLSFMTSLVKDLEIDGVVYSKDEVADVLARKFTSASASGSVDIKIEVVDVLPSSGSSDTIYLVPKQGSENDSYDEYIFIDGKWELIGSTDVNLSDYYTKEEADARFSGGINVYVDGDTAVFGRNDD